MSGPEAHRDDAGQTGESHDTRYFEFHDAGSRLAGFVRVATDLATSEAVTSVCLWLPDGRTALASQRAPAATTEATVRTGGTRVRVNDPVEDVDVVHDGRVQVLDAPGDLDGPVWPADGGQVPAGPSTGAETRLRYTFGSALHSPPEHPGRHAQLNLVAGTVKLGDFVWEVDGRGLRCSHRTPAPTPAPVTRRSIGAAVDDGFGFFVTESVDAEGQAETSGFVWEGTSLHPVSSLVLDTASDDGGRPLRLDATLAAGDGRSWHLVGRVRGTVPVDSPTGARATAALTVWTDDDGREGTGTAHHLDPL